MDSEKELFETSWFESDDFSYHERYYNPSLKKSFSRKIDGRFEYFEPDSRGEFESVKDPSIKLRRMLGRSKETHDKFGVQNPIYLNIREKYWRKSGYNNKPRIAYLDIETRATGRPDPENAPEQVTLIQWLDSYTNVEFVLGLRDWKLEPDYKLETNVKYFSFQSEVDLLDTFLKIFEKIDPLIIYAWNGEGFDYPYLYHRIKNLGLDPNRLSNHGTVSLDVQEIAKRKYWKLKSGGHYFLDLMEVYKRFNRLPRASYALDYIAELEVHDKKVNHDEFPTFDSFYTGEKYIIQDSPFKDRIREEIRQGMIKRQNFKKNNDNTSKEYIENEKQLDKNINFQFVYYGIQDSNLLKKIDEKLSLTKMLCSIAEMMGVLFVDVIGTVKPWAQYISNVAYYENKAMPKHEEFGDVAYSGGYVRDPEKGKHYWVMNIDVNSMYPQLSIAGANMSIETMVPKSKLPSDLREYVLKYFNNQNEQERLKLDPKIMHEITKLLQKYNLTLAVNGVCYRRDKIGILPRLVNEVYDSRKVDKKQMFRYEQRAVQIGKILTKRGIQVEN